MYIQIRYIKNCCHYGYTRNRNPQGSKEPGKGTGLGLSVSYRIIEEAGGKIQAESTVNKGTLIKVRLPLVESERG